MGSFREGDDVLVVRVLGGDGAQLADEGDLLLDPSLHVGAQLNPYVSPR